MFAEEGDGGVGSSNEGGAVESAVSQQLGIAVLLPLPTNDTRACNVGVEYMSFF